MNKCSKIILIFIIPLTNLFAQIDSSYEFIEEIENIAGDYSSEDEESSLYDQIEYYLQNPVNINEADLENLLAIPFIDLSTAESIINYKNAYGIFYSTAELESVKGIDPEIVKKIFPFISVEAKNTMHQPSSKNDLSDFRICYRSRAITDLQTRDGFSKNKFSGSKLKSYQRLIIKNKDHYQAGILIEKDAGEKSLTDFSSFFVKLENIGFENKILAGDYMVEFGQGLALWSAYGINKGSNAESPSQKRNRLFKPATGANEYSFFRGGAAAVNYSGLVVSGFYSWKNIDANIDSLSGSVISIPVDGYHRTTGELNKKNKLKESITGIIVSYNLFDIVNIGGLYFNAKYDRPFTARDIFDFSGNEFTSYSFSYSSLINKFLLSGEFSYNGTSVASINSCSIIFNKKLSLILSVRNYPRNYYNIFSKGFGEKSSTQNEFGIYTGIKWKSKIGTFNFYFDQFKFPYSNSDTPLPGTGYEFMADYFSKLSKNLDFRFHYLQEKKEVSGYIAGEEKIIDQLIQKFRTEIIFNLSKDFRLKTRLDYITFSQKQNSIFENGFLIYQDIFWRIFPALKINSRVIFFQTDSYDSKVYEFENELKGIMYNPALFGTGTRFYIVLIYELFNGIVISLKYSETYKPRDNAMGLQVDLIF